MLQIVIVNSGLNLQHVKVLEVVAVLDVTSQRTFQLVAVGHSHVSHP